MKKIFLLMAILFALLVAGCGGGGGGAGVALQSITVTPDLSGVTPEPTQTAGSSTIYKGQNLPFTATGKYSDGSTADITTQVVWTSDSDDVTILSQTGASSGMAYGAAEGAANITASLNGVTSTASPVTVLGAVLTEIDISPDTLSVLPLPAGYTQQFTATGIYTDGPVDVTNLATWTSIPSGDGGSATINYNGVNGLAYGVNAGTVNIKASLTDPTTGTFTDNVILTISNATLSNIVVTASYLSIAAGVPDQFTATGYFSDGTQRDMTTQVAWSSSNTGVATIDPSSGVATGVAGPGTTTITATYNAVPYTANLAVTAATLSSLTVTADTTIQVGGTEQFDASLIDSDGNPYDVTAFATWSATDLHGHNVATIDADGLATGLSVGTSTITASWLTLTGSTTLTVSNAWLVSIAVTPANGTFVVGWPVQFTATGTYSDGSTRDITRQVMWKSSSRSLARVSNSYFSKGVVTPRAAGTPTITATDPRSRISGSTTLTAVVATLQTITITPADSSVAAGSTLQFTATGNFSGGYTEDITNSPYLYWSSSDRTIASFYYWWWFWFFNNHSQGLVRGISAGGPVTITATVRWWDGSAINVSGTTLLTVTP